MTRRGWILTSLLLATGCDVEPRFDGVAVEELTAPPVDVSIEADGIELVVAAAVKVSLVPHSSGHKYPSNVEVELQARDDVFAVWPAPERHKFVLIGLRSGESCVEVLIEDTLEECIPVRVRLAD